MTMNEMRTFVELGYGNGLHAPASRVDRAVSLSSPTMWCSATASPSAPFAPRPSPGTRVGLAENLTPSIPVIETPEHIAAARRAIREENAMLSQRP